jgi:methionyl-tRNA formyltransferase
LEFVVARNKKELKDAIAHHCCSVYIMYSCGIIVPEEITQKVKIINFHAGSL